MAPHKLVERAMEIAPALHDRSEEIERGRRVPADVALQLAELGMFRMLVPQALRGFEVPPRVMVDVLFELARGDAACAWHVMTGATNGVLSAYLPLARSQALWGEDPKLITAGVFAPMGRATPVEGGFELTGRWPFASGCENAAWLMGGGFVEGETKAGRPLVRSFLFERRHVEVKDTWHVSGLCGTGSHHIEVDGIVVPEEHSCLLGVDAPRHDGALYRFPVFGLLAAGVAAVALGIGRAAIDAFSTLAKTKRAGSRMLAQQEDAQRDVAHAEGEVRSGTAFLRATCDEAFELAQAGPLTAQQRAMLRLAVTRATWSAVRAVDAMYHAGGGSSLYRTSSLQRHFRDVHAVTQHIMVSPQVDKLVGRVLLGVETDITQL